MEIESTNVMIASRNGCGDAALEQGSQRDADDLEPRMTFNLIESRYTSATTVPDLRVAMAMQNGEDGDAILKLDEIDQMDDGHLNVIQDGGKSAWLLLYRLITDADLIHEFVAQTGPTRLVPTERFRDIGLRRFPNEQARH